MRRFRRPSRRSVVMGAAALAVLLCVGLFVRAYQHAGTGGSDAGGGFGAGASGTPASPTPDEPAPVSAQAGGVLPAMRTLPRVTYTAQGGPGFTIVPAPTHKLVLSATSTAPIGEVGYLIPTSPHDSYGAAKHVGDHWVLHTTVTGKPYYAAIFLQAGATGAPITCTITLDGKVIDQRSTSGPYGRQVCVG